MPPTAQDRLLDVLESIADIDDLLANLSIEQFHADKLIHMATERYLEIVCEATRTLPDDIKAQAPQIARQKITDFGNRLRHAYHATGTDKVWQNIKDDLPPLKTFAERASETNAPGKDR